MFGQRALLEEPETPHEGERSFARLALATQEANLQDTEIEVIYERDGERLVLVAAYDAQRPVTTRVFTLDGEDCRISLEAFAWEFPARIFSWSEIETLGRQPRLQRLLIDRLTESLADMIEQREQRESELRANREEIGRRRERLTELLDADAQALRRYSEYKAAFERLNTPEVAALFAELDALRERVELLEAIEGRLDSLSAELAKMAEQAGAAPAAGLLDEASENLSNWWSETAPRLGLEDLAASVNSGAPDSCRRTPPPNRGARRRARDPAPARRGEGGRATRPHPGRPRRLDQA